jgi:hypothetical protein
MSLRRPLALALVLVAVGASMGPAPQRPSSRTTNFAVYAPTPEIAARVGQWAEYYRKQKALEWLGYEMPNWPQPCPLIVKISMDGPRGATTFQYNHPGGGVLSQHMTIEGPLERLIYSVLPHEVTHTVFAFYFRQPLPRWADEGGAVLSEDEIELEKHNKIVRGFLNGGREFPLRRLLSLKEYPRQMDQVVCLYAQGFSLAHYLVHISDKQRYLRFVAHGMSQGWDGAAHAYYGCRSVEELEQNWKKHLIETKGVTIAQLAKAKARGREQAQAEPVARTVVRTTLPPAEPLQPTPVYRGAAPSPEQQDQRFGDGTARPGYLPNPETPAAAPNWQPPRVRLRPPELGPAPDPAGQPLQAPAIPGFPGP